ncbi:flagellar hook-length control protein FliK [Aliarcobacter butzleri]
MLVSNGSLLNILLPNNNKVLNDVLKEADSKNLEQMLKSSTSSTSASTILKELFTSLKDGTKSNTTIENMLKNSATFKELGNVSTNLSSLVDELSTDENLQKFKPVLENFLKDVKNIDANALKEQIKNSGIFLESKLSQTPNSKLENVLTQLQNLVKDINTPQTKQVNELIDKLLQNIKTQTNTNTQITQNQTATNEFTNNLKTLTSSLQNLNNSLNPTQTQNLSNLANQLKSLINEGTLVESKIENSTNLTDKTTNLANNTTLKDSINLQTKELLTQIKNDIIQNPNMIQNKNILPMIDNLLKMDNLFSKNDTIQNFLANSNSSGNLSTFTSNFASNLSPLLTTLKESLETLNPNNTHLQNHLTKLVDKVEHIIQDLATTPNGKIDTKVSEDMKTVLLQMQDELASKTDPKSLEVAKQVDRLLTQIDLHQLTSLVSNSNYVYLPFFWEMLEDGSIEMKQKDEEKFFCQINLTLKDFGKVDLMLGLYDKNKLDLTIYAQREHFKTAIRENMQQLKIALNSVELIPVNVKLLDMKEDNKESSKPTQTYINNYNNQDLSSGIDIRA